MLMTRSWKVAAENQNLEAMKSIVTKLRKHTSIYLDSCGLDQQALESEGLGLRPLVSIGDADASVRSILARRYYRLAQWRELCQGGYWLTVSACLIFDATDAS